ncbi:protein cutoff-like [Drosophila innubila]|uniref:protein cutoff-like n=1 Tax=Drosophila innubila TaxID=198719 RepID=UPI00148B362E|nr:protein cutoff-like [Drosophila innubila]
MTNKKYQLSRPMAIGHFSLSRERIYRRDKSELKFLLMPDSFPLDLKKQYVKLKEADISPQYLDNMLYFIRDNKELMLARTSKRTIKAKCDIITNSDVLQALKCTIYTKRNWRILGTKFLNTNYLCLAEPTHETSQMQKICQILETKLKLFLYSDTPKKQYLSSKLDGGHFYRVFQLKMDELTVVYESPMGARCYREENSFTDCKVIPPRYSTHEASGISQSDLELSWWSECSLNGVEEIRVARPTASGHVDAIETIRSASLVTNNSEKWSEEECNNCMIYILRQICNAMTVNCPDAVYQFDYDSDSSNLVFKACYERSENTFISDWYRRILKERITQQ